MWVVFLYFSLLSALHSQEQPKFVFYLSLVVHRNEVPILFSEKLFSFLSFNAGNLAIWQPNAKI